MVPAKLPVAREPAGGDLVQPVRVVPVRREARPSIPQRPAHARRRSARLLSPVPSAPTAPRRPLHRVLARQRSRPEQTQRQIIHHQGGVAVAVQLGSRVKVIDQVPQPIGEAHPQQVRSWPNDPLATPQPPLSGPTRFSAGTRTSLKNTSLKSRSVAVIHEANGRRSRPGCPWNQQHADAFVLRRRWIGAHKRQQHSRRGGPRRSTLSGR